jgi:hypothetical protein
VACRKPGAPEFLLSCRHCAKTHLRASLIFTFFPGGCLDPCYNGEERGGEGRGGEGRGGLQSYHGSRTTSDLKTTLNTAAISG